MSEKISLQVKTRTVMGKKAKQLRAQRLVPANIIQANQASHPVVVGQTELQSILSKAGDSSLIYLQIEGEKSARPTLIDEVILHSTTSVPIHVVFKQVSLKEKIKAEVPVELVGESSIPDSVVVLVHDSVEVEALPTNLPEKFVIDASQFTEIDQMVTFDQLQYDKDKVVLMVSEEELNTPVVMVQAVKAEEAEETSSEAGLVEPETTTQKADSETEPSQES